MHVRRGLLLWGFFLLPLGAIPLLARAGLVDTGVAADAVRLWPLVLVIIGLVILLSRTRISLIGTAMVAVLFGSLAGTALAAGPAWIAAGVGCGQASGSAVVLQQNGTFDGPALVLLDLRCGTVTLDTAPGSSWRLAATHDGPAPTVEASGARLAVTVPQGDSVRRQDWTVTAPADRLDAVDLTTNAGTATIRLDGAQLSRLRAELNAGDLLIDAGSASVGNLDVSMNAGRARIQLGDAVAVTGHISVNVGAIDLCVPAGAPLDITVNDELTFVTNLAQRGLARDGGVWHRAGTTGAPAITLSVEGDAASLTLDPEGGCR
jgi:hypothetical protein